MIKKIIPFALLVLAFPASALVSSAGPAAVRTGAASLVVQYAKNGTPLAVGQRSISAGATSGEALIRDMLNAAGPAGNLPLTVSRTVTASAVAAGLARVAAKAVPGVALAVTAVDLIKGAGLRIGPNGLEMDPGTESSLIDDLSYQVGNGPIAGSMSQACTGYGSLFSGTTSGWEGDSIVWRPYKVESVVSPQGAVYLCAVYFVDPFTGGRTRHRNEPVVTYKNQKQSCGNGVVRLDGLCESGVYSPATEEQALPALDRLLKKVDTAESLKALIDSGGYADSKSISVSGPQSQTSAPSVSTKTGPAGTVTTTTTNNYQYNYAGDTINYTVNQTTVTQTTAPDGATETTTETGDKTPEKTNCELYPKSIGCMELGEAEDEEIPEREEELELSPEDVALPSGCPADLALPGGRVVSYASACDAAQKMRPLVIAAGVFSALLIAVAAIRGNG